MQEMLEQGASLPVSMKGRVIYYVGPVDPVGDEVVGPAGPTTSTRMDRYTDMMLDQGLLSMIGKAERGPDTVASIAKHKATYLIAVGGAAVLVAKAIRSARVVAFEDLGMEAIREFEIEDMPVTLAVSADGQSLHASGPAAWARRHVPVLT
jgi:fumarate hydratase class I